MNDRTCIVTRGSQPADRMIRFVAGPEGVVVADLRGRLPGRGCWVSGERALVARAAAKNLFARALKANVRAPDNLDAKVEALLSARLGGMIALARKAGQVATGAAKVNAAVRSGRAIAVIHALDAADDGVRKIDQARHARAGQGGGEVEVFQLLTAQALSAATGVGTVVHLAALAGEAGQGVVKQARRLARYRTGARD